jgi:predicted site-specific integrase-resolvase
MPESPNPSSPEPYVNIQDAAKKLGVHAWALRRAVKAGAIPAYTPFNGRKLVRLSEVVAAIDASRIGS